MRMEINTMDLRMPLYLQIKNIILDRIDSGELLPGECIESERFLSAKYGVNRQTIRSAIHVLVEDGILEKIPHKGTFVSKEIKKPQWGPFEDHDERRGFSSFLKSQGYSIRSKVIIAEKIRPTQSICSKLNLQENEEVYCLERVRYTDDDPFSVEIAYMPYKFVEGIENYDFSQVSLYDFLTTRNHCPYTFKRELIVSFPSNRISKMLKNKGYPVYSFQYIGYDQNGEVVEYTRSYIRSDKGSYRFVI